MAAAIDDHVGHVVAAMEQVNLGHGLVVEKDRQCVDLFEWLGPCIRQVGLVANLALHRFRRPAQRPLVQIVDKLPNVRPTPSAR